MSHDASGDNRIHTFPRPLSNRAFCEQFAQPGRVGLVAGDTLIDRAIARAQRHQTGDGAWGGWTHAFIVGERRGDGQLWVIESDLDMHRKHIRLGAQENRIVKYHDETAYSRLAFLDFRLTPEQFQGVLVAGLDLVASRTRYSLRELFGTLLALRNPHMRPERNPLARPESFYCSALVRHLFATAGVDLVPGMEVKNSTPEDLWQSSLAPEAWLLDGAAPHSHVAKLANSAQRRLKARLVLARRGPCPETAITAVESSMPTHPPRMAKRQSKTYTGLG